jgi:hypothetical protein
MIISVINHTRGVGKKVADEEIHAAIRSINRQVMYDFQPYWSLGATLRLEGRSELRPDPDSLADMRGDAVLYVWSGADVDDALGYHDQNHRGIPFGFVFTELSKEIGEPWSVTLSHEAIELIGDPEVNLLVQGPHPGEPDKLVFHWYELCDAVQAETYRIEGVEVSNFVLPLYFTGSDERGGRNDFLGRGHKRGPLRSFGINTGGYIGFFNPETNDHETVSLPGDAEAARRVEIKSKYLGGRRALRHQYRDVAQPAARRAERPMAAPVDGVTVLRRSRQAPR